MNNQTQINYSSAKTWQIALFTMNNAATNTALFLMGYYAYFSQNILGLTAVIVGGIATAMRVFDGITDPFIGVVLDKTNTRFGRFRPFMLAGALVMCASILGIFNTPQGMGRTMTYLYTTVLYAIYILGYTCQTTVTKAAQAVITNDPKQRPLYSGFDALFTRLSGAFLTVLLTNILAEKFAVGEYAATEDTAGTGMLNPDMWRAAAITLCAFMMLLTVLAMIGIASKDKPEFYLKSETKKVSFKDYADIAMHNRPIQMLIIAAATDKLGTLLQNGLMVYLFANLLLNTKLQGIYTVVSLIPVMIAAFIGVFVSRKLGLKRNFISGTIGSLIMLGILMIYRPDPSHPWIWMLLLIVQNCVVVLANSSVVPMLADCADYENYRSGKFVPGMIGTMFSFIDKLLSSISSLIVGIALTVAGVGGVTIVPNQPVGGNFNTIILLFFCGVPILGHIASLISMKFYELDGKRMEEIQTELERRK